MNMLSVHDVSPSEAAYMPGKKTPWAPMTFIGITCPHCSQKFVELHVENMKTERAAQCLKHLRVCEVYKANGGGARRPSAVGVKLMVAERACAKRALRVVELSHCT